MSAFEASLTTVYYFRVLQMRNFYRPDALAFLPFGTGQWAVMLGSWGGNH